MHRSTDINNFRSPSAAERELISTLTAAEFAGRAEVIKQLQRCVVRLIDEHGSLEVSIPPNATLAPVLYRVPTELYGPDVDGVQISVLLHVVDEVCCEIEIYKVDGTDIQRMPAIWQRFVPGPDETDST